MGGGVEFFGNRTVEVTYNTFVYFLGHFLTIEILLFLNLVALAQF